MMERQVVQAKNDKQLRNNNGNQYLQLFCNQIDTFIGGKTINKKHSIKTIQTNKNIISNLPKCSYSFLRLQQNVFQQYMTFQTILSENNNSSISRRNNQFRYYLFYNHFINATYTLKTKQLLNALHIKQIQKTIHSTSNSINKEIFNPQSPLTSSKTNFIPMYKQSKERHASRKEVEEETYKEFIRQKVLKYQHQIPRMTESEIYNKIGREWQALNQKQKQQLYNLYVTNHFIRSQTLVKQQFGNVKQSQGEEERQNNELVITVPKDAKIEEKSLQKKMARKMAKQQNQNQGLKQQIITQNPTEQNNQTIRYVQLGQNLSKKLTNLNQNSKQTVSLYKTVLEEVQKEHNKLVSSLNKQQASHVLPVKIEESAKNLKETKKPLQKIDEQLPEKESSELSPEPNVAIKKQAKRNKTKIEFEKVNKGLIVAIKQKLDQSLRKNTYNIRNNQKKCPNLIVNLQQKPAIPKKTNDYLQFYKQGYKRLKQQCSYLNGLEITRILTHLWQKRKAVRDLALQKSRFTPTSVINNLPEKKIELSVILARKIGKINFIKFKLKEHYLPQEAQKMWAGLPLQSKIRWIYPEEEHYLQVIEKQQNPLHGKVLYSSNHTSDSHLYDLDWDIFDNAPQEKHPKYEQKQSKSFKQQ